MAILDAIYRYPVKGLSGQRLSTAWLDVGKGLKGDRAYAISRGALTFNPQAPTHVKKNKLFTLMTHAELAALRCLFDDASEQITIILNGREVFSAALKQMQGVIAFAKFLQHYLGESTDDTVSVLSAPGHMFSDVKEDCISIVNMSSIQAVATCLNRELDPLRFRANFYLEALEPWAERSWQQGDKLIIGECVLSVMRPITRCAATNVNLKTAQRDARIPQTLIKQFGANTMGVYAEVIVGGNINTKDNVFFAAAGV